MTAPQERISQQRLDKLGRLCASGIDPYPHRYQRTHTNEEARALIVAQEQADSSPPAELRLAGRITAQRSFGKGLFMDLQDGTGKTQLLLPWGRNASGSPRNWTSVTFWAQVDVLSAPGQAR